VTFLGEVQLFLWLTLARSGDKADQRDEHIIDRRAKLLGLYPREGQLAALLVTAAANGEVAPPTIEFVVPGRREAPEDTAPPPAPPFAWQRQLAPPTPMQRDPFGVYRPMGPTE
jgi:hypothetical protein